MSHKPKRSALLLIALLSVLTIFSPLTARKNERKITETIHSLFDGLDLSPTQDPGSYTNKLMKELHLDEKETPFAYAYDTEFYTEELGSVPMHPTLKQIAIKENNLLNKSFFYKDLSLLNDPFKVRKYQLRTQKKSREKVSLFNVVTRDGEQIDGTYFDRGSDQLLIVGAGFTNFREKMAPFGDMFTNYDLVFFDFRGHAERHEELFKPKTWKSTFKRMFGIDRTKVKLGLAEELDVLAVVNHMRRKKEYKQVTGLGICYSAMIFLKTSALYPHTFDKLICDGTWLSLGHVTNALSYDIKMISSPQRGGAQDWAVSKSSWFRKNLLKFSQKLFGLEFNTLSVLDYVTNLPDIPVLFVHGKDDIFISRKQFETVWHAANIKRKAAMITSHPHVWNHLKGKEEYKLICDQFITRSFEEFSEVIADPAALIKQKTDDLQKMVL